MLELENIHFLECACYFEYLSKKYSYIYIYATFSIFLEYTLKYGIHLYTCYCQHKYMEYTYIWIWHLLCEWIRHWCLIDISYIWEYWSQWRCAHACIPTTHHTLNGTSGWPVQESVPQHTLHGGCISRMTTTALPVVVLYVVGAVPQCTSRLS